MMRLLSSLFCFALALGLSAPGTVSAKGTVRVQEHDGTVRVYDAVTIKVAHKTLRITSADGKGTLIIDKAACSYIGEIQRCLPYSIELTQNGSTHPLDFKTGTVYVNMTGSYQQLPMSSSQLPPRGILMSLETKIGTHVSLSGKIDEVSK